MDDKRKDEQSESLIPGLGRRDLIKKLGAGVVATALAGKLTPAQDEAGGGGGGGSQMPAPPPGSAPPDEWRPHTGPGFQNTFNRYGEDGQMDDSTRAIVDWVAGFKPSDLTPGAIKAINRTMVDSMGAAFGGFEEEAVRVAARTTLLYPAGQYKCTVFGYGITSTPEAATFANSCMVRLVDFNDTPHNSNLIPAAFAIGEALHKTGSEVMAAVAIGYQMPQGGEGPVGAAMAAGKLMGLDADRLANAVTLALTPHVALNKGVGAMSMWKGCRSAEAVKCGIWGAILAQQGMTGPPQPFEGRGGLWYSQGRLGRPFEAPTGKLQIELGVNKRFPSDQQTQQVLAMMPEVRAWTKPEEIEWIEYYTTFSDWEETDDAAKWDPRNRDTADHSVPYVIARNIISGESYLDAFALDKFPFRDPQMKELINKITVAPVAEWRGNGTGRLVIHKKSGEEKYWDAHKGSRDPGGSEAFPQMSDDDITAKFKRSATYRHVDTAQMNKALEYWWNLGAVKDFAVPMQQLAKFGKPQPL